MHIIRIIFQTIRISFNYRLIGKPWRRRRCCRRRRRRPLLFRLYVNGYFYRPLARQNNQNLYNTDLKPTRFWIIH